MQNAASAPLSAVTTTMTTDWSPLVLSALAGASTSLGASIAFCTSKERPLSDAALAFSLALAGSVMMTVSIVSLLPESFTDQHEHDNDDHHKFLSIQSIDFWKRMTGFVTGCVFYWGLSKAFPEPDAILGFHGDNDHHDDKVGLRAIDNVERSAIQQQTAPLIRNATPIQEHSQQPMETLIDRQGSSSHPRQDTMRIRSIKESTSLDGDDNDNNDHNEDPPRDDKKISSLYFWKSFSQGQDLINLQARRSWRVAMLLFVSLVVHNFPEGIAVGATAMHSPQLGLTTAIAIALHNVPEGIAIAVPCLAARPDAPWLAFGLASASGLAEPLGAAVAMLFLSPNNSSTSSDEDIVSMGSVLSFVAGVMIMVAVMELFPEAMRRSTNSKLPMIYGTVLGAAVMIGSDAYLND